MSVSLLEKLKKKPIPQKEEIIKIALPEQPVEISTLLIDKTSSGYNRESLLKRIKSKEPLKEVSSISEKDEVVTQKIPIKEESPDDVTMKIKVKRPRKKPDESKVRLEKSSILLKPSISEVLDIPVTSVSFGEELLTRIPKRQDITIKSSQYYLNNREIFVNFINSLFEPYKEELASEKNKYTCDNDNKNKEFQLLINQKIVRDYINIYSPYRGLLLYHGLGSGKTCSSIAIAEGIKNNQQVIIMTPASLRSNYIAEIKKCGDILYRKSQYWEFISVVNKPETIPVLANILSLPVTIIEKNGGAWFININKKPNYEVLSQDEKNSLDKQIDEMISAKYNFINYNGLRKSHLKSLTKNKKNPFDNAVVIIDEAHNFVGRIVNKLHNKKSLWVELYEFLLSAQQCRIVFLTGTPVINYPNEIGVLFNILRGYIKTYYIPLNVKTSRKMNNENVKSIIEKIGLVDYIEYKPSLKMLVITRNPFGFVSDIKDEIYEGVHVDEKGNISDDDFIKVVQNVLNKNDIEILQAGIRVENFKALPDKLDDFLNLFVKIESGNLTNTNLFKRRIMGLTSYYRSGEEQLLPKYNEDEDFIVEKIPMSDYQFGVYEEARVQERKLERLSKKKKKKPKEGEMYSETVSTYRIFSRAFCNFVFPRDIERPLPDARKDIKSNIDENIDEETLDVVPLKERIDNVDGRFTLDELKDVEEELKDKTDDTYEKRINSAIKILKKEEKTYLNPEALETYSPKFLRILENIKNPENKGLNLIYSQFRTLEGIGILKLVLEANGFAEFKIKRLANKEWTLNIKKKDVNKPKFALYTGTETVEEKEIIRNIFNGTWENVPNNIVKQLKETAKNNNYGELIKILMITAAGSEGINLKNVRYVHIVEPYWHPVRIEQVIGRARRICSHNNLLEPERNVRVYLYLMTFSKKQLDSDSSIELRLQDKSKLDKNRPLSSDEALYEISTIKGNINKQILKSIKETSIDCSIYAKNNEKEGLVCLSFGSVGPNKFSYKPSISTDEKDNISDINKKEVTWKAVEVKIEGKKYAYRKDTKEVYDYDSYIQAIKNALVTPVLIGKLIKKEGKYVLKKI